MHFVQKIIARPVTIFVPFRLFVFFGITFGSGWIFCTKCDFMQDYSIFIRFLEDFERSDRWAEVVCHFHLASKQLSVRFVFFQIIHVNS